MDIRQPVGQLEQVDIVHKKRRLNTASKVKSCAECRRLKLKCDRQEPCNNCVRRGIGSICPDGALKPAKGRTLILDSSEALHDRIASLEQALQQFTSIQGGHPLLDNAYHLDDTLQSFDQTNGGTDEMTVVDGTPHPYTAPEVTTCAPTGSIRSALGIPCDTADNGDTQLEERPLTVQQEENRAGEQSGHLQVDKGDLRTSRFFGDASSLFLANQTAPQIRSGQPRPKGPYTFRKGWIEGFLFEEGSALRLHHSLHDLVVQLPTRDDALRLSRIYFDSVAWGSNILLESSFTAEYFDRFYSEKKDDDAQRLAVLCFALALGALFDPMAPMGAENNPLSCDLFALGRASLSLDSYGSIIFVQAIHLMVTWLNNGGRPVPSNQSTWPLVGLAMRVVQALGLHRDGKHFNLPAAIAEERRRVFWEMFSYDIAHSVASARPRTMADGTYDVEFPVTPPGGQHYHEYRYRLCQLECKINDEQSKIAPTPYDKVVAIDREFRNFQQHLPAALTVNETTRASSVRARQPLEQVVHIQRLTMRFRCNVCFLVLHRGWFARALEECPEEPLRSKYCPSFVGCLEACKLILGIMRQLADDAPLIFQRRWFLLFHAFTACVCLSAAVIRAPQSILAHSCLPALEEGIKLFEDAGKTDEHAMLCPLLATARRSFVQSGGVQPASDDDLALLGKRSHRTGSVSISNNASSSPLSTPPTWYLHSTRSELPQLPNDATLPLSTEDHSGLVFQTANSNPQQSTISDSAFDLSLGSGGDLLHQNSSDNAANFDLWPPDQLDWSANSGSWAGFDMESFMATFGLGTIYDSALSKGATPDWSLPGE